MTSFARHLAEFVVETPPSSIPRRAREVAVRCIRDCVGTMIAGSRSELGKIVLQYTGLFEGTGPALVVGSRFRTSIVHASFANAILGHALSFDDSSPSILGHPSVTLVPPALAIGDIRRIGGEELLVAYVLGHEVEARLGKALNPHHYIRGWHATGTLGSVGAAAVSARLLGLSADRATAALTLAATQASGLRAHFGTLAMLLHAGTAARNGVLAALLAEQGLDACETALEGREGFLVLFGNGKGGDWEQYLEGLGSSFDVCETGIDIKAYPCGGITHRSVYACLAMVKEHDIQAHSVAQVETFVPSLYAAALARNAIENIQQAKISMRFPLAVSIIDRECGLRQFSKDRLHDPQVLEMMARVAMRVDPELDRMIDGGRSPFDVPITTRITTVDGAVFDKTIIHAPGSISNPLPEDTLREKFLQCSQGVLTPAATQRSLALLDNLEGIADITQLTRVLSTGGMSGSSLSSPAYG